jgi:hypothetical protein
MLSDDVLDIVWGVRAKGDLQALGALLALCGEAVLVFAIDLGGFLAVADEVDDWVGL